MHDVTLLLVGLTLFSQGWQSQSSHHADQREERVNYELASAWPAEEWNWSNDRSKALASLLLAAMPSSRGYDFSVRSRPQRFVAPKMKPTPMVPYKPAGFGNQFTQWISVYNRMAYERIITMFGVLDDNAANQYLALLLHLQNEDPKKKVTLYINLLGGSASAGLALRDAMSTMTYDIETVNVGYCGDIGAFLVASGTKGKRYAMPSSKFRLAGPRMYPPVDEDGNPQQVPMQASDLQIEVEQVLEDKKSILEGFSKFTGRSLSQLEEDFRRDFYLSASQAIEYGLVDQIIEPRE